MREIRAETHQDGARSALTTAGPAAVRVAAAGEAGQVLVEIGILLHRSRVRRRRGAR